jgi:hypothetical protein
MQVPRPVAPRNLHPYKGIGVRPDGSVILAITQKGTDTDDLARANEKSWTPPTYIDAMTVCAADWSTVCPPPDAHVGAQWSIAQAVGEYLFRSFSGNTQSIVGEAVMDVALAGRVATVRDGLAYLVYRGSVGGDAEGTPAGRKGLIYSTAVKMIDGVGVYDVRSRQMLSLTWVWEGLAFGYHKPQERPPKGTRFGTVVEWRRGDTSAAAPVPDDAPVPEPNIVSDDSTPENALKTFLLALAAQDEPALRAVTLPDADLDWLLRSQPAAPDLLAGLKARLKEKPMRRLKEGDPVRMPDGEWRAIKPADVRAGRVVLWPDGELLPARVENVDGHWKVFARPFIAARKQANP